MNAIGHKSEKIITDKTIKAIKIYYHDLLSLISASFRCTLIVKKEMYEALFIILRTNISSKNWSVRNNFY